jgi:murein DD-endopeptidase MepM/ murein hydrolase activator NlpD
MKYAHLITTITFLLLGTLFLWMYNLEAENVDYYLDLLETTTADLDKEKSAVIALNNALEEKEREFIVFKENAACMIALAPLLDYMSEDDLEKLLKEVPRGNPFETNYLVTASFGESTGFFPRENHSGQDMIPVHPEDMKWSVRPTAPGIVYSDGWDAVHGKNIIIKHSDNIMTRYSHLGKYYYIAKKGLRVTIDSVIGIMGDTGLSTNAHLHYEIWIKVSENKWVKINPKPFVSREEYNVRK